VFIYFVKAHTNKHLYLLYSITTTALYWPKGQICCQWCHYCHTSISLHVVLCPQFEVDSHTLPTGDIFTAGDYCYYYFYECKDYIDSCH